MKAVILGSGQIGTAAAVRLLDEGWTVTLASRRRHAVPPDLVTRGARFDPFDRATPGALPALLGGGTDLLIDTIAYDATDAAQLSEVAGNVGALVVISSASVYRDDAGRTLDEARTNGFPDLPVPIGEAQPTVAPGPETYSTRKVALETRLLDEARCPVTILRPCAVHGTPTTHPREWWFVKRLLDGRPRIPLAHGGRSRFHTSAAANIAALIAAVARSRAFRVLNAVDPCPPTVAEIGAAVMAAVGCSAELAPVEAAPPPVGITPWNVPRPFVLDDAAARAAGYLPVGDYAATVAATCRWLAAGTGAWRDRFPALAAYPCEHFDYAAEDAWLAASGRAP